MELHLIYSSSLTISRTEIKLGRYMPIKSFNTPANYYKIILNRWWVISKRLSKLLFGAPCTSSTVSTGMGTRLGM